MRVLAVFLILVASTPGIAADSGTGSQMQIYPERARSTGANPSVQCRQTMSYKAEQSGLYRGQPLAPRKLTELPPAIGYMAVYRHIGGCEAPLTMVEYRNPRRR